MTYSKPFVSHVLANSINTSSCYQQDVDKQVRYLGKFVQNLF